MAEAIQAIFVDPPIAVARLGASTEPQDAFTWTQSPDPRADGDTAVVPKITLKVLPDGSVQAVQPTQLDFRDAAGLVRPVCPFFEIWALVGEPGSDPATWRETPLTRALLARHRLKARAVVLEIDAHNLKAARRTGNPDLAFGTHPPVQITADQHDRVRLAAVSPPGAATPMIPRGRFISFGFVQVMRDQPLSPGAQRADPDLEVLRFRFTPAQGRFYGPPQAATTTATRPIRAVDPENAFLDPGAGWFNARVLPVVQPSDTFDGAEQGAGDRLGRSLGVVDDTCGARITVRLALPRARVFVAHADVFVAPPDFGADRRPFLSLADELNDRSGDAANRSAALSATERDGWVEDLFERVYETVSLFNVDRWRDQRAIQLTGSAVTPSGVPNDGVARATRAMGGQDALRNHENPVPAPTTNEPLPLAAHARSRHVRLADLQFLRGFIAQFPGRLELLVRRAFEIDEREATRQRNGDQTSMRMPPFMRQSNAQPLTLAAWQYDLLMAWVRDAAAPAPIPVRGPAPLVGGLPEAAVLPEALSDAARERRTEVLARVVGRAPS